jgi:2Fe-2S ferredoxin
MPTVRATDRRGREHELIVPDGAVLMEELRLLEDGVFALCGGACACATCHVYVDAEWHSKLSTPLPPESDMLIELPMRQSNSRLSCQVVLGQELTGLKVTIAPDGE